MVKFVSRGIRTPYKSFWIFWILDLLDIGSLSRPDIACPPIAQRAAMGETKGTGVVIQSYAEETIVDPMEWPSGAFLLDILRENQQLESLDALGQLAQQAHYWQAAARRALMQKFGYYQCATPSSLSPNNNNNMLDSAEIESIQQAWTAMIQRNLNVNVKATNQLDPSRDNDETAILLNDLMDFVSSRCQLSNGRSMQWAFMTCPVGVQFALHAHPNLELVYCCTGALHEVRMDGPPIPHDYTADTAAAAAADTVTSATPSTGASESNEANKPPHKVSGPSLTSLQRSWTFGTLSAGQWLVNEVGSIHKSFTATNATSPCRLLVCWGGSHANIAQAPATLDVNDAVSVMDRRLCECHETKEYSAITETFLPASERKRV
jgi:hypothetical protein